MPVSYGENKLIPAPLAVINKQYVKSGNGENIGTTYSVTLNGTLVAWKGSPTSSGSFWTDSGYPPDESIHSDNRHTAILRKQEAIRKLFSQEGMSLEFTPWDGGMPLKCNPRVVSIDFPEGMWFDRCEYTITLEADTILGLVNPEGEDNFTHYLQTAEESWSLEYNEQPESDTQQQTFRLTHNLNAQGKRHYDVDGTLLEPWEQARSWVQDRLGIDADRILASGAVNLPAYMQGYNHVRIENVDKRGGSYSVTETWLVAKDSALEDFTVEVQESVDDPFKTVTINGTITGLELRDADFAISQTKYESAVEKWNTVEDMLLNRAQNYAGESLHTSPVSKSIGKNPVGGVITYNYTYNNRPSNCISGARTETITVTDNHQGDIFANIPVPGRIAGPVLQDINTKTAKQRQLSIEALMPAVNGCSASALVDSRPDTSAIVAAVKPNAAQIFKESDTESWSSKTGRYTRNVSWTYE